MAHRDGSRLQEILQGYERALILLALEAHGGNQRRAAGSLRILPSTLSMKMRRLQILTERIASWHPGSTGNAGATDDAPPSRRGS